MNTTLRVSWVVSSGWFHVTLISLDQLKGQLPLRACSFHGRGEPSRRKSLTEWAGNLTLPLSSTFHSANHMVKASVKGQENTFFPLDIQVCLCGGKGGVGEKQYLLTNNLIYTSSIYLMNKYYMGTNYTSGLYLYMSGFQSTFDLGRMQGLEVSAPPTYSWQSTYNFWLPKTLAINSLVLTRSLPDNNWLTHIL